MKNSLKLLKNNCRKILNKNQGLNRVYFFLKSLLRLEISPGDFRNFKKLFLIVKAAPYTMLSYTRLSVLYELVRNLERDGIQGDIVECGVFNGGSTAVMAGANQGRLLRKFWLFDSWEGMPDPTIHDVSWDNEMGEKGIACGQEELVKEILFSCLRLPAGNIHLVKGWFQDVFPKTAADISQVALLHLDCDWYESVKLCLAEFYDHIVPSGYLVIDDFGHWRGCRKAVEEFFANRNIPFEYIRVDETGIYLKKK